MGRGDYRNYYKGHMDKTKGEGGSRRGRWLWLGWSRNVGRKCRQLYLNINKIIFKKLGKINETENCSFEKIKIDTPLTRLIQKKKRDPNSIKSEMKAEYHLTEQKFKEL